MYRIRGACFDVFRELGCGLLERVYRDVLAYELRSLGLKVCVECDVPI